MGQPLRPARAQQSALCVRKRRAFSSKRPLLSKRHELGDDQRGGADAWRYRGHYFDHLSCSQNPQSKQGKPARSDERFDDALERLDRTLVENPDLAALWIRALRSFDDLDATSKLRFGAHLGRFLRMADSLYLGVLDGTLDKRLWRGYERTLADTVAYPGFQAWWATRKHWHTDEFCALIDRHIQTAKPKIYDSYT